MELSTEEKLIIAAALDCLSKKMTDGLTADNQLEIGESLELATETKEKFLDELPEEQRNTLLSINF